MVAGVLPTVTPFLMYGIYAERRMIVHKKPITPPAGITLPWLLGSSDRGYAMFLELHLYRVLRRPAHGEGLGLLLIEPRPSLL